MKILIPDVLKKGDTIGIVAPSAPLSIIDPINIEFGIGNLQSMGFHVMFAENVNLSLRDYSSGQKRASDIMDMFENPQVNCVMAAIGGYSAIETLKYIDFSRIHKKPKNFIGFSDITVLNLALFQEAGLVNYYGPTFAIFCQKKLPEYTKRHFISMLMQDGWDEIDSSPVYADDIWYSRNDGHREWKQNHGTQVAKKGTFSGECIGGNLDTLLSLAGTPFFPDLNGRILFLEEANNRSEEEIRRKLFQLEWMNVFESLQGLVFGRFWGWDQENQYRFISDISNTLLRIYDFPILANVDFGHSDPICSIPVGGKMDFDGKKLRVRKYE